MSAEKRWCIILFPLWVAGAFFWSMVGSLYSSWIGTPRFLAGMRPLSHLLSTVARIIITFSVTSSHRLQVRKEWYLAQTNEICLWILLYGREQAYRLHAQNIWCTILLFFAVPLFSGKKLTVSTEKGFPIEQRERWKDPLLLGRGFQSTGRGLMVEVEILAVGALIQ